MSGRRVYKRALCGCVSKAPDVSLFHFEKIRRICKMNYEYLFPEFIEEDEPSFFDAIEDLSMHTKGKPYCPRPYPPYKCVTPRRPRYCRPQYPIPCPPPRPQCPTPCYPLYPLPQWPRPCYPSYPCQRYPPQWICPKPISCVPQRPYYPQLPCPPNWGRPCYPKYQPQYPCDFLELY